MKRKYIKIEIIIKRFNDVFAASGNALYSAEDDADNTVTDIFSGRWK